MEFVFELLIVVTIVGICILVYMYMCTDVFKSKERSSNNHIKEQRCLEPGEKGGKERDNIAGDLSPGIVGQL